MGFLLELTLVGMDPSLRNWGIAVAKYNLETMKIKIIEVDVIRPVVSTGKQVRQNSLDLETARQLYKGAYSYITASQATFIEVPVGSQSARSMASYGVCVGILGALRAAGKPFYELTPTEVKLAATRSKTATKSDMISWALETHPEANWPVYKQSGKELITESKAEHMADAIAAIHAGVQSQPFQQMLPLIAANH